MRIAFAADDENECVRAVLHHLRSEHQVVTGDSPSWTSMSRAVAEQVVSGECDFGVLMCWTGTGTAIAANKVAGARAATVADAWTAGNARRWNDANILALSLKRLAPDVAVECVRAFLDVAEPDADELTNIQDIEPATVAANYDELPLWSAPFGQLILERVPLRRGQTIVDIGAGTGFLTIELAQRSGAARVIAVDPWAEAMDVLRHKVDFLKLTNVELVVADASKLDLPDASVDVIVSNLGINNFDNAATVLAECHRVLRPGGRLLISTNLVGHMAEFYEVLRGKVDPQALEQHINHRATVDGTLAMLKSAGFSATVDQDSFVMRFADATALFNHYFIRLGFLDGWQAIAGTEVLAAVEQELNQRGELSLTIPTAVFNAVRS
jgi:arsenite methyltransferase